MRVERLIGAGVPLLAVTGMSGPIAVGFIFGAWATATAVAVYIVETVVLVAFTGVRLWLLAPERLASIDGKLRPRAEAIQGFVLLSGVLAVFSAIFGAIALAATLDVDQILTALRAAIPLFALTQALALLLVLWLLRRGDQAVAERWMLPALCRGCILAGSIWLSMLALLAGFDWFATTFLLLKLMMEIGVALEDVHLRLV